MSSNSWEILFKQHIDHNLNSHFSYNKDITKVLANIKINPIFKKSGLSLILSVFVNVLKVQSFWSHFI